MIATTTTSTLNSSAIAAANRMSILSVLPRNRSDSGPDWLSRPLRAVKGAAVMATPSVQRVVVVDPLHGTTVIAELIVVVKLPNSQSEPVPVQHEACEHTRTGDWKWRHAGSDGMCSVAGRRPW